ncbi:putative damage-inducible protein DinB [Phyllobacterium ifriqiyense]|uniref:Damage-inducible protein DinB n=1 Tax=Phyllobacterium ifriqiyense TaxID=314238 RepID=A0ABU0S4C8_9HYPH|nr:DinB family protein [Phyllobacterium ifriqiyense]MDQ0995617.1 putative damage-inducible protein DinB [Phyllobacterium ifriqiyense]
MKDHFTRLARYNQWANKQIYEAAALLDKEDYFADRRAYFKSMHGTLNHLLAVDKLWFGRFTGNLYALPSYDVILHDTFGELRTARIAFDEHIIDVIQAMEEADISAPFHWVMLNGAPFISTLDRCLTQIFNHQTHHRGQAHTLLSQLTGAAPPLDFFIRMNDDFIEEFEI